MSQEEESGRMKMLDKIKRNTKEIMLVVLIMVLLFGTYKVIEINLEKNNPEESDARFNYCMAWESSDGELVTRNELLICDYYEIFEPDHDYYCNYFEVDDYALEITIHDRNGTGPNYIYREEKLNCIRLIESKVT